MSITKLCTAAAAAMLVLPAGAAAKIKVHIDPDPAAPAGQAPQILVSLSGLKAKKRYQVHIVRNHPGSSDCLWELLFFPKKASSKGKIAWPLYPGNDYDTAAYVPICNGNYKGHVEVQSGKYTARTARSFKFSFPKLKVSY